jgi:hypothetical protein
MCGALNEGWYEGAARYAGAETWGAEYTRGDGEYTRGDAEYAPGDAVGSRGAGE